MAGRHDADIVVFRQRQVRADVQIIAEDDLLGRRIMVRLCKVRPVVIDHHAEADRGQHRRERHAHVAAAEDIGVPSLRQRFDIVAGVALFRERVGKQHRPQRLGRDAVCKAQAVGLVERAHGADAAAVHPVDEPAVIVTPQQLQNALQQRPAVFVCRIKVLEIDRHVAAADHADVGDLVGREAVALHQRLLALQNLQRLFAGALLYSAAANGADCMPVGEDGHFCARAARRGAGRGENAAQHDALPVRERLQHGCKQLFHSRSSILIVRIPSRLICGR